MTLTGERRYRWDHSGGRGPIEGDLTGRRPPDLTGQAPQHGRRVVDLAEDGVKGRRSAIEGRGLFAVEPIGAGEELTIDYAMIDGDPDDRMECRCGTPACRGVVSGGDWRRPDLQARYGDFSSWYLLERIRRHADGEPAS